MRASSAMMMLFLAARVRARSCPRPFLLFLNEAVPVVLRRQGGGKGKSLTQTRSLVRTRSGLARTRSLVRTRSVSGMTPLMLVMLLPQPLPLHRVVRASSVMMVPLPLFSFLRRCTRSRSREEGVSMVGGARLDLKCFEMNVMNVFQS